jgi:hypothetical protein
MVASKISKVSLIFGIESSKVTRLVNFMKMI